MAATAISSLYPVALTICLFAAGILGCERAQTRGAVSWLSAFLTLVAVGFGLELLMIHPATPLKGLWLGLRLGCAASTGPVLWLAVRELTQGARPRWRELGRGHRTAWAAAWLLVLPVMVTAHLGTDYANPAAPAGMLQLRFVQAAMLGCVGIFVVQTPLLLLRCRDLLLPSGLASPLRYLLPIVGGTWAFGLLRATQCVTRAPQELFLLAAWFEAVTTVGAIYLLVRHSRRSAVLPTNPDFRPVPTSLPMDPAPAQGPSTPYARSSLTPVIRERIERKLRTALGSQQLHRDPTLSLRSLSAALRENPHYVSQVLNQHLGSSFYDLINQYRVEEAKDLLRAAPDRTALDIALAVGFNSKSTFNAAFRRVTGMTPREWRAQTGGAGESARSAG